jgi:hypothetical protein
MMVIETEPFSIIFLKTMFHIALIRVKICMGEEKYGEIRFGPLFKWSAYLSDSYMDLNTKQVVQ